MKTVKMFKCLITPAKVKVSDHFSSFFIFQLSVYILSLHSHEHNYFSQDLNLFKKTKNIGNVCDKVC